MDDQQRLVAQPIGYWCGEAYRRIAAALRDSLAAHGLTQPQWWALDRLEAGAHDRAALIEELAPYSGAEEGLDVGQELDRLVAGGLAEPAGDGLVITTAGLERLGRARARNRETHQAIRAGVTDAEYTVTIDVLRRMVGNLGGDPRLPGA